jgi:hypothetical protein
MSNAALKKTSSEEAKPSASLYLAYNNDVLETPNPSNSRRIQMLAAILVTLQVLDGILTYTGMYTFGVYAEGNPILRALMHGVGIAPAIAITKLFCIGIVLALCAQAHKISWLPTALTGIAGMYAIAAVLPWSWLLVSEYLT